MKTEVEFTVWLLDDTSEHVVYILGDAPNLGAWDIDKAVPMEMVKRQEFESKWNVNVAFAPSTSTIDYKYIVKHSLTHELVSWEGLPGNRTLTIARGTNIALGASSTQMSTYTTSRAPVPGPRVAKLGNNGNTNGYQEWRCCRTMKETNPWWEVDLGQYYNISSIHLWNAMTYHEQAKHPEGRPPVSSSTSTSFAAPPLWVFISKEPLGRGEDSYIDAQNKVASIASNVRAFQMQSSYDSRVRSLQFTVGSGIQDLDEDITTADLLSPVGGRYVRLQYEGVSCALQFAELEVYTQDPVALIDIKDRQHRNAIRLKQDDGFFGVLQALDADSREYVESGWLNPAADVAELQIWIGSFNSDKPAVQWLSKDQGQSRVAIEMCSENEMLRNSKSELHGTKIQSQKQLSMSKWEIVECKSGALLNKESTELRQLLEAHQQSSCVDISAYLNNDLIERPSKATSLELSWLSRLAFIQSLEVSSIQALSDKIATQTYKKGDIILQYAEQKNAVFYIESGRVELFGPKSSTGSNKIGDLNKGSIFNEMGLFSYWSRLPALFQAQDNIICKILDLEALVNSLGKTKVLNIRGDYIRERYKAKLCCKNKDIHYTDKTHAQLFRVKVPFASTSECNNNNQGLAHRWRFDLYDYGSDAKSRVFSTKTLMGSSYLLLSQMNNQAEADLTLPVLSSTMSVVGQLTLSYLKLTPFIHPKNTIASVWRKYWRVRPPLTIGHRGMGRSYYQVDGHRLALTRENTLASLIMAGRSGADYVEFDVQLTKDRVPVVYHDFFVNVGLEDKNARWFGTKHETYEVGLHNVSFRQLTQCYTAPVPHKKENSQLLQNRVKKHWVRLQGNKEVPSRRRAFRAGDDCDANVEDHLVETFPRLQDLLKHVPAEVGLNIEVKYPDDYFHSAMRKLSCFDINAYVDRILQCVFDFAGSRRIFFSCFDPSVCIALRAKQAKYPVLFLTYGSMAPDAIDARMTLQFAINFVKMEKLQGIVSNSESLLETPELVSLVKKIRDMVLVTWGDLNTKHEMVQLQKRHAIDGIISDNVIDLINQDKRQFAMPSKLHPL